MRPLRPLLLTGFLIALTSVGTAAAAPVQVRLSGAVTHAGDQAFKPGARLSDAALAAQPQPQAYPLGGAWLRPSLIVAQKRLKAGVLYDLVTLQRSVQAQHDPSLAQFAGDMQQHIRPMPVTGRQVALLDPRVVEVEPSQNLPLADGDRLYYPLRPDSIRVVGAVQHACMLPLVPLQDARLYLAACPVTDATDHDNIYVIQPDGRVQVQGIALWNRSAPLSLAPGAAIYVPLRAGVAKDIDSRFNQDLAAFLATQLLPGPGAAE